MLLTQIKDEISEVRGSPAQSISQVPGSVPSPAPLHQELSEGTGKTPGLEEEPKAELDFPFGSPLWAGVERDDKGLRNWGGLDQAISSGQGEAQRRSI